MRRRLITKRSDSDGIVNVICSMLSYSAEDEILLIIDPFFYYKTNLGEACEIFRQIVSRYPNVKEIWTVCKDDITKAPKTQIYDEFKRRLLRGQKLTNILTTDDFHDRFIILLKSEKGITIGTSFNGMRNKLYTISTLSKEIVRKVLHEVALLEINHIRTTIKTPIKNYSSIKLAEYRHLVKGNKPNYWVHRIAHEEDVSYELLKRGYLSIGFADFGYTQEIPALAKNITREIEKIWGDSYKKKYRLWNFLFEFSKDDIILVPDFPEKNRYSLYKIEGADAIPAEKLHTRGLTDIDGNVLNWDGNYLTTGGERIVDLGFFWEVTELANNLTMEDTYWKEIKKIDVNMNISKERKLVKIIKEGIERN
ncbi:MAG: hypothetical protein MJ009_05625 [Paludibacteraceae bacterium]|nr:hypothetical protein [Paludibacteraceae bacterium]